MKKFFSILLFSLFFFGCTATSIKQLQELPTVEIQDCDYGIMIQNYLNAAITINAEFYDENNKLLDSFKIGTVQSNKTNVFRYDYFKIFKRYVDKHNTYVKYTTILGNTVLSTDNNYTTEKIPLVDLENSYTVCHYSENSKYIHHYPILKSELQKSNSVIYDETNSYIEFKLYDDLSWLKGKWVMTEGYGYDTLVFEEGSPYAIIDEYNNGNHAAQELVIGWISANDFSDTLYVDETKTKMKIAHPYVMDPSVLIESYYEKVK